MKKILILCTGNSCRSQMAEGYLKKFAGNKAAVYSAGTEVHGLNANAVSVMKEDGVDISGHTSNLVDEYRNIDFDYVITVCDNARERCPVFLSPSKQFHQNFPDPAKATGSHEEIINQFRTVREMIKTYCRQFATDWLK